MKKIILLSILCVNFIFIVNAQFTRSKFAQESRILELFDKTIKQQTQLRSTQEMVPLCVRIVYYSVGYSGNGNEEIVFDYNEKGKIISKTWISSYSDEKERILYEYNEQGYLKSIKTQDSNAFRDWRTIEQWTAKTFTAAGEWSDVDYKGRDDNGDPKESRWKYIYGNTGRLLEILERVWDENYSEWIDIGIYTYQYDGHDNQTLETYRKINGNDYINDWKREQTYKYEDNLIKSEQITISYWENNNWEIDDSWKNEYEYNPDRAISHCYIYYVDLVSGILNNFYSEYGEYFYVIKNVNTIENIKKTTPQPIRFENNCLYIQETPSSVFVEIYTVSGQLILKTTETIIPTNGWNKGVYLVKVNNKESVITSKILVK